MSSTKVNQEFSSYYQNLLPTLTAVSFLAQVISAMTGFTILHSLILNKLENSIIPITEQAVIGIAISLSIVSVLLLEIALRKFIPISYKSILLSKWKLLEEKLITFFLLVVSLILVCTSLFISYEGSKSVITQYAKPNLKDTGELGNDHKKQIQNIQSVFTYDSLNIETSFDAQIKAINLKYEHQLNRQSNEITLWQQRELKTNKSYRSHIAVHQTNLGKLQAEQAQELSVLLESKRDAANKLISQNRADLSSVKETYIQTLTSIEKDNQQALNTATMVSKSYVLGSGFIICISMLVFLLTSFIIETIKSVTGRVQDEDTIEPVVANDEPVTTAIESVMSINEPIAPVTPTDLSVTVKDEPVTATVTDNYLIINDLKENVTTPIMANDKPVMAVTAPVTANDKPVTVNKCKQCNHNIESSNKVYCSNKCKQTAYRIRKKGNKINPSTEVGC